MGQTTCKTTSLVTEVYFSMYQNYITDVIQAQIIFALSRFLLDLTAAQDDFIFTISQKAFKP